MRAIFADLNFQFIYQIASLKGLGQLARICRLSIWNL